MDWTQREQKKVQSLNLLFALVVFNLLQLMLTLIDSAMYHRDVTRPRMLPRVGQEFRVVRVGHGRLCDTTHLDSFDFCWIPSTKWIRVRGRIRVRYTRQSTT